MLRSKPRLKYSGLTLVLSNPSRFDKLNLLSAGAGHVINEFCLRPEFNSMMADIRVAEDKSTWLEGTKCIMLLGEYAMHSCLPETRNNSLNEMRGSLFYIDGIPAIPSYYPQDAADIKNYEATHNEASKDNSTEEGSSEDDEGDVKSYGNTKRQNYAFWLKEDFRKAKRIIREGIPQKECEPIYHIYPSSQVAIDVLTKTKGRELFFDMETDYEEQNMQCFAFSFDGQVVYCVPILDYNYKPAYSSLTFLHRALAIACKDNIVIAHNGASFDFLVLAMKYHIAVNKVYDTMVAHHRCWPDIEKSLGHAVSHLTWERFHKDENPQAYRTREDMMKRLSYCGKDVRTMYLVKQAIDAYAKTIPGLTHSIETAMASIVPYLTTTLQGIRYNQTEVDAMRKENDRLMMQYIRVINILIGESGLDDIKSKCKGKSSLPGSNKQCVCYFHDLLGYPVVMRGKPNEAGQRNPSLAKNALYKLRLNHDNAVIDFINAYRSVKLETSTPLGFIPFRDNNNQIVNPNTYVQQQ